jgi:hypothetical protein
MECSDMTLENVLNRSLSFPDWSRFVRRNKSVAYLRFDRILPYIDIYDFTSYVSQRLVITMGMVSNWCRAMSLDKKRQDFHCLSKQTLRCAKPVCKLLEALPNHVNHLECVKACRNLCSSSVVQKTRRFHLPCCWIIYVLQYFIRHCLLAPAEPYYVTEFF